MTNRFNDPPFTLYWRTGRRDVVYGRDAADAMNNAGHGGGSVRALDFWAAGDDHNWAWNEATREWVASPKES